jgi:hypothetical protein
LSRQEAFTGRTEQLGGEKPVGSSAHSIAEPRRGASFRFGCFFFTVFRWRRRFERMQEATRSCGYFVDGSLERGLIRFRRFVKTADFPYKLERSIPNLFRSNWRIKVEKRFDVPAHSRDLGEIWLDSLLFPFDDADSAFVS